LQTKQVLLLLLLLVVVVLMLLLLLLPLVVVVVVLMLVLLLLLLLVVVVVLPLLLLMLLPLVVVVVVLMFMKAAQALPVTPQSALPSELLSPQVVVLLAVQLALVTTAAALSTLWLLPGLMLAVVAAAPRLRALGKAVGLGSWDKGLGWELKP
jgi:hypothetical protein